MTLPLNCSSLDLNNTGGKGPTLTLYSKQDTKNGYNIKDAVTFMKSIAALTVAYE